MRHHPNWWLAIFQAHLRGGEWVDLMPGGMPGPPEYKWCQNRLRPYLCLGPEPDAAPGDQEAEEYIEVGQLVLSDWYRQQHSHQRHGRYTVRQLALT